MASGARNSGLGRGRGRGGSSHSRPRSEESLRTSIGSHSAQGVFNRGPSPDVTSPNRRGDADGSLSRNGEEGSNSRATAVPNPNNPLITPKDMLCKQFVLTRIKEIIMGNFHGPWTSFQNASEEQRNRWWFLFTNSYRWDPRLNIKMRELFESRGSHWLSKKLTKHRGSDVKPALKPDWVADNYWLTMTVYWASDEFKKRSTVGSKNRNTPAAIQSQYRGGRSCVDAHAEKLAVELNRDPLSIEVYEKCYVPKTGDPPPRVQEVLRKYNDLKEQAASQSDSQISAVEDNDLFLKATPKYKSRRFGHGSRAKTTVLESSSVIGPSGPTPEEVEAIQQKLQAQNDKILQQEKKQQEQDAQMAAMSGCFSAILQQLKTTNPNIVIPEFPFPTQPAPTQPAPTQPTPTQPAPTQPGEMNVDEFFADEFPTLNGL